jgi:hypothetical protein
LISRSSLLSTSIDRHEFFQEHFRRCANSGKTFKRYFEILDPAFFSQSGNSTIITGGEIAKCLEIISDAGPAEEHIRWFGRSFKSRNGLSLSRRVGIEVRNPRSSIFV